jgi:hypothetical protein
MVYGKRLWRFHAYHAVPTIRNRSGDLIVILIFCFTKQLSLINIHNWLNVAQFLAMPLAKSSIDFLHNFSFDKIFCNDSH